MDYALDITLPEDRESEGVGYLRFESLDGPIVYGPFRVLGSTNKLASFFLGLNITGDPLEKYGHTPTGIYSIRRFEYTPPGTRLGDAKSFWSVPETGFPYEYRSYGNFVIKMDPLFGQALKAAENGRTGIWAHGGDLHNGRLRSTLGCLRIPDHDLRNMYNILKSRQDSETPQNRMLCQVLTGIVGVREKGIHFPGDAVRGAYSDPPPNGLMPSYENIIEIGTVGGGTGTIRTNVVETLTDTLKPFGSSLGRHLGENVYGSDAYDQQFREHYESWLEDLHEWGEDFAEEAAGGWNGNGGSGSGDGGSGSGDGGSGNGDGGSGSGDGGSGSGVGSGEPSDRYDIGTMILTPD